MAVLTAFCVLEKEITATRVFCGAPVSLREASVTMPRVPSEPIIRLVRLYPAFDFRGRLRVLTMVPSARTIVRPRTQSFIVPYL